jgi:PAS domain S-box-containing protein
VGLGWNAAAVVRNGIQNLGWLVADNLLTQTPASKPLLDILGLYALTVGTLLAQKQIQSVLRESENRYRLLAENITDVIVRVSPQGVYLYASPSCKAVLGYESEEAIGKSLSDFVHPDDLMTILQRRQESLIDGVEIPLIYRFRHHDGHYIWLEVVRQPVHSIETGEIEEYVASARNVTARKQAEEALQASEENFRLLLDAAPVATLISDTMGRITLVNIQAEALFGFNRTELVGQMVEVLIPAYTNEILFPHRRGYMVAPHVQHLGIGVDLFAIRKDASEFPVEIQLSHIQTKDGIMEMSFVVDITERKKTEDTLRQALAKEIELNELKTRFVSMASHEFRTPLATIHAATETLSAYRHKLSEDQIDLKLSNIRGQVGYLKDIMDDMLKLAQLQMRRVAFVPQTVDFDALCREVIEEAQNGTDIAHTILYTCATGLPTAQLDKKLMRQLISNLVSNAIKYSPQDKTIVFNLEYSPTTFVLSVTDKGIGIPEDDLKHLFEPFHRATNVGTIHGTGLGLVIAKESVELHGGTITVESQIGKGTTITVHIPINAE